MMLPTILPTMPSRSASDINKAAICRPLSPKVLRDAISSVRRCTITNIVFMMPTPPMSSAPSPRTTIKLLNTSAMDWFSWMRSGTVWTKKKPPERIWLARFLARTSICSGEVLVGRLILTILGWFGAGKFPARELSKYAKPKKAANKLRRPASAVVGTMPRTINSSVVPLTRTRIAHCDVLRLRQIFTNDHFITTLEQFA